MQLATTTSTHDSSNDVAAYEDDALAVSYYSSATKHYYESDANFNVTGVLEEPPGQLL